VIDWTKELGADRVVLIVCPTVLEELDEKKFSASHRKIRQRARDSISSLRRFHGREDREVRHNVSLLFITEEPRIDWRSEGLDEGIKDDRIIATILRKREDMKNPTIITCDFAMELKAEAKGIRCHMISDNYLLKPSKTAEEKELEELRRTRDRLPKLGLKVLSGEGPGNSAKLVLKENPPISDRDIGIQVNKERNRLTPRGLYSPPIPESESNRYARDCEKYLNKLQSYLEEEREYAELLSRAIEISLIIENEEGTAPAEDIDIFLYFPGGSELRDKDSFPCKPKAPEEPTPLRDRREIEAARVLRNVRGAMKISPDFLRGEKPQSEEDKYLRPTKVREDSGYEVRYSLEKLKHGMHVKLEPVYVVFPSIEDAKSFHIDYRIVTGNVPGSICGQIHIVIDIKRLV
jgi:hypothetical protein